MVATGLIAATPAVLYEVLPAVDWNAAGASPTVTIGLAVSGILVIGIPIIGLIHILMRHFGWLATHVYCYPDYLYRAVVYSFVCRLWFFLSNTPFIGCLIYQ